MDKTKKKERLANRYQRSFISNDYLTIARRFLNLSTRPPASTNFCLPVKKGWHLEQTSTLISEPLVDLVTTVSPHAHLITHSSYLGWIASFISIYLTKLFHC